MMNGNDFLVENITYKFDKELIIITFKITHIGQKLRLLISTKLSHLRRVQIVNI